MISSLLLVAVLRGHGGWVTQIATTPAYPDTIVSASRDSTLMVWKLNPDADNYGNPVLSLRGHTDFVSDAALSSDGNYAVSGSFDNTLRLWDLNTGRAVRRFEGHNREVSSVTISPDNRIIASGSRDKTIKLWNSLGECKYTIDGHSDWVTSVRFPSEITDNRILVSAGFDMMVKVWDVVNGKLKFNLAGHTAYITSVAVSPNGAFAASGGQDAKIMMWDVIEGKLLYSLDSRDLINALSFNPTQFMIAVADGPRIQIWDLESKSIVDETYAPVESGDPLPQCLSLAWSSDGQTLFAGYTDNVIRVFTLS